MPLKNAGCQISFTSVASNTYAAIIVGHVEVGLVRKHYISPVWGVGSLWTMEAEAMVCESALKRWWQTVEANRSKPIAVLHRRLNTVDEAVRSVMVMRTRWKSSHAVVTLRGPVPARLCIRPYSLHWFHTCITVVPACPVQAAMSWYDKPASRRPIILPHSNTLTCRIGM